MASSKTESNFPFIVSSGPKLQNDPQIRALIRKQAMRDVGIARKRKGGFGKQNVGQYPKTDVPIRPVVSADSTSSKSSSRTESPDTSGSDTSSSSRDTEDTEQDDLLDRQLVAPRGHAAAARPLSFLQTTNLLSGYETTRSKFNLDITDLSMLTNFNVGKSLIPLFAAEPTRLAGLLGEQQWSYMEYVPSRYGESQCLTAAADCVLAKVRSVLAPQSGCEQKVLRLYAKALSSLQKAICDQKSCMTSDVLCATQMLSLHELLDSSGDGGWSHHVNGAIRIVKHRGAKRFNSEFEKALFAGHVGTVVGESLMANEHCYLEEPQWSTLYLDMVQDTGFLTDRSSLALKVRHSMFALPGLWHDVDEAMSGPQLFDGEALAELDARCRAMQKGLLSWTEEYKAHCVRLSLATPTSKELDMRRELFGTSMESLILAKRLLACVCEAERIKLEGEAQALALLIFDLQKQPSPKHSWLFTGHEVGVAYTVSLTRDQWEEEVPGTDIEKRLAARNRYVYWNELLRTTEGA